MAEPRVRGHVTPVQLERGRAALVGLADSVPAADPLAALATEILAADDDDLDDLVRAVVVAAVPRGVVPATGAVIPDADRGRPDDTEPDGIRACPRCNVYRGIEQIRTVPIELGTGEACVVCTPLIPGEPGYEDPEPAPAPAPAPSTEEPAP